MLTRKAYGAVPGAGVVVRSLQKTLKMMKKSQGILNIATGFLNIL